MAELPTFKDEKTEEPTPKKISKERNKGNIFYSQEMSMVLGIFFTALVLRFVGSFIFSELYTLMKKFFMMSSVFRITDQNAGFFLFDLGLMMAVIIGPIAFLLSFIFSMATLLQTGWVVSWEKANWKFNKIFEINWKALFSFDSRKVVDLVISLFKLLFFGIVLFHSYKSTLDHWIPFLDQPVINIILFITDVMFWTIIKLCVAMFLLAIFDFWFKYKKWWEDMKMTKWEVKEEKKQAEGDPRVKRIIAKRRFELFKKIMMEAVPRADVVITNPTHFAVAISYKAGEMEAPKVVAKGVGALAQKIKDLAAKNGVPLVENKPLAQVLFKTVEVGSYVPESLYKAVAEVLAYVYSLKRKSA